MSPFGIALRFARRDFRSGLANFRIFLASLTLGVATIAGVGSLGDAFLTGLSEQGRTLLGGDVALSRLYQPATDQERAEMEKHGRVSESIGMRSMAITADDTERTLVEIRAVDNAHPLLGSVDLQPAMNLTQAIACSGICGIAVEPLLLERLKTKIGNRLKIGEAEFEIRATIASQPDRVSGGFTLGPQILISHEGLQRTKLVVFGSMITYAYRIAFPASALTTPDAFRKDFEQKFPEAGWEIRDRDNAVPQVRRFVDQATMFLTLIGLTALVVGGVGAGQAVTAFLDRRRATIATLKALGAEGIHIFLIYLIQVLAVAAIGVGIGLVIGAALPFVVQRFAGDDLPAPAHFAVYASPLITAAAFGFLAALGFAIPPLARAKDIAPAGLFRDLVAPSRTRGATSYIAFSLFCFVALALLAIALSPYWLFTLEFLGGAAGALVLLRLLGAGLRRALARVPAGRSQILRLALANLTRPGTPTAEIVVALGLGLTVLATVTLTQATIQAQVADQIPSRAPSFFFVDVQKDQFDAFKKMVTEFPTAQDFNSAPSLRGRIMKLNGVPVAEAKIEPGARGLLNGDRGVTYASEPPKDTHIVEGTWWAKDYRGPTLVSFSADLARRLNLKIGDTITMNILGRDFDATIANLRDVEFRGGGINFFMVFSPGFVDLAPHTYLATVRTAPDQEEKLFAEVTRAFPNASVIRVKDALAQLSTIVQTLARAMALASIVTIFAGILVLSGAIAAGHRARLYEAVLLKVLGSTRARLGAVYVIEYGLLGVLAGLAALLAGTLAAWGIARFVLESEFVFDWQSALLVVTVGAIATLVLGLAAGFAALSAKPAARLRNP